MSFWSKLSGSLGGLIWKEHHERHLDEELHLFEELLIEEKIGTGLTPAEARREARLEMGTIESVKITLDEERLTIVGVLPRDFEPLSAGVELYRPFGEAPDYCGRGCYYPLSIARLKPDVSLDRAQAEMDSIALSLGQEYPDLKSNVGTRVELLHEASLGQVRLPLTTLFWAVTLVLLIAGFNVAALLLARSNTRAKEIGIRRALGAGRGRIIRQLLTESCEQDPGFSPRNLLSLRIEPRRGITSQDLAGFIRERASKRDVANRFYTELITRIRALPGVESAAAINVLPFGSGGFGVASTIALQSRPAVPLNQRPRVASRVVTPGYFRTMKIPLLHGRAFEDSDIGSSPFVAIVNKTMAQNLWGTEDPLGKRIMTENPDADWSKWMTVVGVVGDVHFRTLENRPVPVLYVPFSQARSVFTGRYWSMGLIVRTQSEPLTLAPSVRAEVHRLDKILPILNVAEMEGVVDNSFARRRFTMLLLGIMALIALILAAVGIYGVLAYMVSRRMQEIGVRMALGARAQDIFRLVVGRGLALTFLGSGIGLAGAIAMSRFLQSQLFGVSPTDRFTLGAVWALIVAVAALACYVPARRAVKVDPTVALHYE